MFSRVLCEWKPDLCDERRQILDMGYLFACTRSKTNAFQVDKVQTPGLEQCCCHFGLFLIYAHAHVLSHVLYDFTMPLVMATQKYVPRRSWCTSICLSINTSKQPTNQPTWKQLCYKSFKIQEIMEKILSHTHTQSSQ